MAFFAMIVIWRQKIWKFLLPEKPAARVCNALHAQTSHTIRGTWAAQDSRMLAQTSDGPWDTTQNHQTVVVEKSKIGEGPAGAALMFGRVRVEIAVMPCATEGRRLAVEGVQRLSAPWIKRA
eukprot:365069-Chlamydomonas_euryale.AAC.18